jgi:hypothetical protein
MSPTPNGTGLELEKFPDAPPTIAITTAEETPDAGLRSLDHCEYNMQNGSRALLKFSILCTVLYCTRLRFRILNASRHHSVRMICEISLNTFLLPTIEHPANAAPVDKRRLPPWRYNLRQKLLPLIRWETPYLAWMQNKMRSPALDSYFAITANLGTHTFFMVVLPILFWCGHTSLGRG